LTSSRPSTGVARPAWARGLKPYRPNGWRGVPGEKSAAGAIPQNASRARSCRKSVTTRQWYAGASNDCWPRGTTCPAVSQSQRCPLTCADGSASSSLENAIQLPANTISGFVIVSSAIVLQSALSTAIPANRDRQRFPWPLCYPESMCSGTGFRALNCGQPQEFLR